MTTDTMTCQSCGQTKNWRDGFPTRYYAMCWRCVWEEHMREEHPISRGERRSIRKQARRIANARILKEARDLLSAEKILMQAMSAPVDDDSMAALVASREEPQ